jgi:hypothetical protein
MRWRSVEDGETTEAPVMTSPSVSCARGEISEIVFRQIAVPNHRRAVRKDGEAVLKGQPAGRQGGTQEREFCHRGLPSKPAQPIARAGTRRSFL